MTQFGIIVALLVLALMGAASIALALRLWPAGDPIELEHTHDDLPLDHPHLLGQRSHSHAFVVDDLHPRWTNNL